MAAWLNPSDAAAALQRGREKEVRFMRLIYPPDMRAAARSPHSSCCSAGPTTKSRSISANGDGSRLVDEASRSSEADFASSAYPEIRRAPGGAVDLRRYTAIPASSIYRNHYTGTEVGTRRSEAPAVRASRSFRADTQAHDRERCHDDPRLGAAERSSRCGSRRMGR